jgi:hypothetical protein
VLEHDGEPGLGLDPVRLRRRHETRHERPMACPDARLGGTAPLASKAMERWRGMRPPVADPAASLTWAWADPAGVGR